MSRRDEERGSRSGAGQGTGGPGGIPDGLLIGILVFLLGMTLLVWSSAGLAGLFAHGSWPSDVTFARTPLAMRHLITHPNDVPGAWPATPKGQLSGYGLLWGLFISQLMILFVLLLFTIGTVARWRAQRAAARERARTGAAEPIPSEADQRRYKAERYAPAWDEDVQGTGRDRQKPGADPLDAPVRPSLPTPRHSTASAPSAMATPSGTAEPSGTAAQGMPSPGAESSSTFLGNTAGAGPFAVPVPSGGVLGEPSENRAPAMSASAVVFGLPDSRRPVAVQAVRDAEGPVLALTSDPGVWAETKDARAKLGPVLLYDPTHRCDTPARLHWSPSTGCTDRATAAERARALLAPVRPTARIDAAVADTAETLLRCFLHAAAVDGRQFRQVHRWAQGQQVQDAVRTLRSHPKAASGAAGELEAALTAHPERRDIAQELTARALSALSSVHIRDSCTPNRTDTAALGSWMAEGGTLYVVGEALEDPKTHPGAMPLLTAMASSVVEHGRRMAERSSSGRLDPPLVLVLEDVAAVAPLPQLPALLNTGAEQGMPTLALLRSREQARTRWPDSELPA